MLLIEIFDGFMNRFFVFSVSAILVILAASSCCEKRVYCTDQVLGFSFTGFARNEVRSFTLRRYIKDDNFNKVLDSAQFIYYGTAPVTVRPDTLSFADYRTIGNLRGITTGNDWAIHLPATGKVYYFNTIFDDNNKAQLVRCGDDNTTCARTITNFSINNEWQSGSFFYLAKDRW